VTTLALSSDYVMRTGAVDPKDAEVLAYKELPKLCMYFSQVVSVTSWQKFCS